MKKAGDWILLIPPVIGIFVIAIIGRSVVKGVQGAWAERTVPAIALGVALVGAAVGLVWPLSSRRIPTRCTMCDNELRQTYHTWTIDGERHHLCPYCNQRMERRQSSEAFDRFRPRRRR